MQVKIIKKNDEYSSEYAVGDIFEVEALKKIAESNEFDKSNTTENRIFKQ